MKKAKLIAVALCLATPYLAASPASAAQPTGATPPVVDNERVTVREVHGPGKPAEQDFVAVSLSEKGTAIFGHRGDIPGKAGTDWVVIELKEHPPVPLANTSGYPLAFPRVRAKKLLENERVVVWSYRWNTGEPTVMHFHDKDAVVVYEDDGVLKSTTPDGKSVSNPGKNGDIRFSPRARIHTEVLLSGAQSAVITELK